MGVHPNGRSRSLISPLFFLAVSSFYLHNARLQLLHQRAHALLFLQEGGRGEAGEDGHPDRKKGKKWPMQGLATIIHLPVVRSGAVRLMSIEYIIRSRLKQILAMS